MEKSGEKKFVVLISECTSDCNVTLLHLFSFSQVNSHGLENGDQEIRE